jgi:hypothetical protein
VTGSGTIQFTGNNVASASNDGIHIYVIFARENIVTISQFHVDRDILDFSYWKKSRAMIISSIDDLSYSSYPLTLILSSNQFLILVNIQTMEELTTKNFRFALSEGDNQSNEQDSSSLIFSSSPWQLTLFIGCVCYLAMVMVAGYIVKSTNKKEKSVDLLAAKKSIGRKNDDADDYWNKQEDVEDVEVAARNTIISNEKINSEKNVLLIEQTSSVYRLPSQNGGDASSSFSGDQSHSASSRSGSSSSSSSSSFSSSFNSDEDHSFSSFDGEGEEEED